MSMESRQKAIIYLDQNHLSSLALEEERVAQFEVAIDEYDKVPQIINDFCEIIEDLGPNPFKGF
jgi:quinone-modifying oxidoreductase subunit QmoB